MAFVVILLLQGGITLTGLFDRHVQLIGSVVLFLLAVALGSVTSRQVQREVRERQEAEAESERLAERLRLGQKLEAVGRLAGGVAHDFNNLLTAVLGYCDLLALRLGTSHPQLREVGEIRRAARRAATLISQLLAFSRKQVIDPRRLDLNRVVRDSVSMIRRMIGEDVALECRLAPEPCPVRGDPTQLEQLLINLAVNARDAMPSGGRLEIATGRRRLDKSRPGDIFEVAEGEFAYLTVSDTGEGMDEEILAHAFEPFFTTKDQGRGTGLGLATVYGIVKQNQGYIWVDSRPQEGSEFQIFLPLCEGAVEEDSPLPVPPVRESAPATETVLLVEDEPAVRSLVREVLIRGGYSVLEAGDAQQAFEVAARHRGAVELLLTDLVMPGVAGDELARRMALERPDLRVLYISGYSDHVLNRKGVLMEGTRLLQKPFSPEDLLQAVEETLAGAPPEAALSAPAAAPAC